MQIFVLEDNTLRIKLFREFFARHNLEAEFAVSVDEAKEKFNDPDVVFLDHDLGQRIFVDSREPDTGYQFAVWLRENDEKFTERTYIVHSLNNVGAGMIMGVLADVKEMYRIPFDMRRFEETIQFSAL